MQLRDLAESLRNEIDLEDITWQQYERSARSYSEHLGRPAAVDDLATECVNRWLATLSNSRSAVTVRNYRTGLLRLWHYAAELGLAGMPNPRRIRRPKVVKPVVQAWSLDQFSLLINAAETMQEQLRCGIKASEYLLAWLWLGYETGLRPSDLRRLRWPNLDLRNCILAITQHKTGTPHTAQFGPETSGHLDKLRRYGLPLVFPLGNSGTRKLTLRLYNVAAKSGFIRRQGEGLGTLRKLHATEIYRQYGLAAAAESLGHGSGTDTARRHYVDSSVRIHRLPPRPTG